MGIKVNYTPYGAVGGLAEHAGQAQQAIREQQYTEQEADQARSIAAQKEMQATQIGASREEWQRKLTTQQEQFAMNQALQQEQIFRQQQASEFATMKQSQVQRAQIAAQEQQFEQNLAMQQQRMIADKKAQTQAFELQQAQESRLLQSAQANIQAQEMRSAFDFKKLETAQGTMTENLEKWKQTRQYMSPEEQVAGDIAISLGKIPRIRAETSASIEESRRLGIEKKKLAMAAGLTDRGRTVAQEVFEDVFGKADLGVGGLFTGASESELLDNYKSYQVKTGYSSKNDASKRELDNVFDRSIIDYEAVGWFDYYSDWDPESPAVKNLRIQSKGPVTDAEVTKILARVDRINPGLSQEDRRATAEAIAVKEGWEL